MRSFTMGKFGDFFQNAINPFLGYVKSKDSNPMQNRIEREKAFHDCRFNGEVDTIREKTAAFYAVARRTFKAYRSYLLSLTIDKPIRVLEYGCGEGGFAFELAYRGANVVGIDISEVAVEKAIKKGMEVGCLEGTLHFEVMNAEDLKFQETYFDLVCGSAILHHLDIRKAYKQIHDVLKPGGEAVFLEPLGHNPLINLYRRFTPSLRTPDEHPLLMKDIRLARRYFTSIQIDYFCLFTLLASPFVKMKSFSRILSLLELFEINLFSLIPFSRHLAWSVILKYRK